MSEENEVFEYLKERLSAFIDEVDITLLKEENKKIYVEISYPPDLEAIVRGIVGYAVYDAIALFDVVIKPTFKVKT